MHQHLLLSLPLLLVCQFALTQQNLRLTDASSVHVYWQATDGETVKVKIKKTQKTDFKNAETPIFFLKNSPKSTNFVRFSKNYNISGKLNTKDKAYESRFWFGGQRAVLLAHIIILKHIIIA